MKNNNVHAASPVQEPLQQKAKVKKPKSVNYSAKRVYFAFPYLALSIIFVVVPLLFIFAYAFMGENGGLSFESFSKFANPAIWRVIGSSFLMAIMTTLICLLLCYPLALALARLKTSNTAILVLIFILPMWINSLLRIYAIRTLLPAAVTESGFWGVLIGMVYDFLPFMLLPIYTIIVNTDKSVIEASYDLGASPLKTLLKVRLPLSVPGIVSGVLMVFMPTVSNFAVADILSLGKYKLFGNLIDNQFGEFMNYAVGAAYSIMLMLLIIVSVLIANKLSKGKASLTGGATV